RLALRHGAEGAATRAQVAEDHERGRPASPALTDIGTARAFAHRMQAREHGLHARNRVHVPELDLEPIRTSFGLGEPRTGHGPGRRGRAADVPLGRAGGAGKAQWNRCQWAPRGGVPPRLRTVSGPFGARVRGQSRLPTALAPDPPREGRLTPPRSGF